MFLENHMYLFEGKDYSKEPSKEDMKRIIWATGESSENPFGED